jgi:hypothetical protein
MPSSSRAVPRLNARRDESGRDIGSADELSVDDVSDDELVSRDMTPDRAPDPEPSSQSALPPATGLRRAVVISLALLPLAALLAFAVTYGMSSAAAAGGCGGG